MAVSGGAAAPAYASALASGEACSGSGLKEGMLWGEGGRSAPARPPTTMGDARLAAAASGIGACPSAAHRRCAGAGGAAAHRRHDATAAAAGGEAADRGGADAAAAAGGGQAATRGGRGKVATAVSGKTAPAASGKTAASPTGAMGGVTSAQAVTGTHHARTCGGAPGRQGGGGGGGGDEFPTPQPGGRTQEAPMRAGGWLSGTVVARLGGVVPQSRRCGEPRDVGGGRTEGRGGRLAAPFLTPDGFYSRM